MELKELSDRISCLQEKQYELKTLLSSLTSDLNDLAGRIRYEQRKPSYNRLIPLTVRVLKKYLTDGLTVEECIYNTAVELDQTMEFVRFVYYGHNPIKKATETRQKYWAVLRMKKLKYPITDIARVSGYSEKYIHQIVKRFS